MRRIQVLIFSLVTAAVTCGGLAAAAGPSTAATVASGTWGSAQEVPGTATLNTSNDAVTQSVSCASAGNCTAAGYYQSTVGGGSNEAFVADEADGTWGSAQEIPGTATLNAGGRAEAFSVSCPSAGNCAVAGYFTDSSGHQQAFVADEASGTWGTAQEIPGTAALNTGGAAQAFSVSCASAGNCAVGGQYGDSSSHDQAFVADEASGTWGSAQEVPGTATLNADGTALVKSVSCASAGNCAAAGQYEDSSGKYQAYVADEASGTWGSAQEAPGTATLNANGNAEAYSVSCPSAGNCTEGGYYEDASGKFQAYVADETSGTWGNAQEAPGTASLNADGNAAANSVSCASAGNCAEGGFYEDASGTFQAYVADETSGTWGNAQEVPGTASLNADGNAQINSVSCPSAGNCTAGGFYEDSSAAQQAFVADEAGGTWGSAQELPGTASLNTGGNAAVNSVSCASAGDCASGGDYATTGATEAFVADEAAVQVSSTTTTLSAASASDGLQLTATVSGAAGSTGTPAGTVTFADGSTSLGSATLSGGKASVTDRSLPAGDNAFTATFSPSSTSAFAGSSGTLDETVPVALTWVQPGSPSISGTDAVGDTLTANPGTWGPSGVRVAYQWFAGGSAISGATGSTLALGTAEYGENVTVEVTGFAAGDISVTATSPQTAAIGKGTLASATPAITGAAKVGYTLHASVGTWTSGTTFTYQWLANGATISGATGSTLSVGTTEYNKKVSVRVTGSKTDYTSVTKTSGQTATVVKGSLAAPTPKITGTAKVGDTLRISLGTWTSGTTFTYQWLANGSAISKATGSSFKVGSGQEGKRISVRVTGSKTDYTSVTRTSAQTAVVPK